MMGMLKNCIDAGEGNKSTVLMTVFFVAQNSDQIVLESKTTEHYYFGGYNLKKQIKSTKPQNAKRNINYGKLLFTFFVMATMLACSVTHVFAAPTVWEKATEIFKDVYNQILLISTIAAIVTASVALLMMNFSKSGRTVDEARSWLKRICITWVILNGLGFIMAYVTPFFSDGKWNG
jgi:Na+-driven multidrug efflux pump